MGNVFRQYDWRCLETWVLVWEETHPSAQPPPPPLFLVPVFQHNVCRVTYAIWLSTQIRIVDRTQWLSWISVGKLAFVLIMNNCLNCSRVGECHSPNLVNVLEHFSLHFSQLMIPYLTAAMRHTPHKASLTLQKKRKKASAQHSSGNCLSCKCV